MNISLCRLQIRQSRYQSAHLLVVRALPVDLIAALTLKELVVVQRCIVRQTMRDRLLLHRRYQPVAARASLERCDLIIEAIAR